MATRITRRTLMAGTVSIGAAATLAGGSHAQEATPEAYGWSLTDGRGQVVSAETTPTNVIAQTISAASLWDLGVQVKGVYGDSVRPDGTNDPQAGDIDFGQVEVVGDWASGLDLEKVIAVDADLFVDVGRAADGSLWSIAPDVEEQLLAICPTFSVKTNEATVTEIIVDFEALAESLGADTQSPDQLAARDGYAERETAFREVVATKPGLKVLIVTGDPITNAFFVDPTKGGIGLWMQDQGLDLVVPENLDPEQLYIFETASWEEIGKYPADVLLYDSRLDATALGDDPIWSALPAVMAGQVGVWYSTFPYSYQKLNPVIDAMIETISNAEVVTG